MAKLVRCALEVQRCQAAVFQVESQISEGEASSTNAILCDTYDHRLQVILTSLSDSPLPSQRKSEQ